MPADVIDTIGKLLAMADPERNSSEPERNLAMQKAQSLMAKHNLSVAEVHGNKKSAEGDVTQNTIEITGAMNMWKVDLIAIVGSSVFVECLTWKTAKHGKRIVLIGREDNLAFTRKLTDHVIPWLEGECKTATKHEQAVREEHGQFFNPRAFKRSYMQAATGRIFMRLRQHQESIDFDNALVTNERKANQDYISQRWKVRQVKTRRGSNEAAGHRRGAEAGSRADITPGRKLERG